MIILLFVVHVLIALTLIGVVMLQKSEGGALGTLFAKHSFTSGMRRRPTTSCAMRTWERMQMKKPSKALIRTERSARP